MLTEISYKSREANEHGPEPAVRARLPRYTILGVAVIVVGEVLLFARAPLIGVWFTPIMWTGYILFVSGLIKRRRGVSLLSDHLLEFILLALISIGSWLVFEGYNLLLGNWRYVGLPENLAVRYTGYAWAFATISPGIFVTFELLDAVLPGERRPSPSRLPDGVLLGFVLVGLACLAAPLIWPSTYMSPLVWMGFGFLLDPINGRLGERSFLTEFFTGRLRSMSIMFLAGLICGFLWEFWNYWATTKWHYDVPYLGHIRLFEMPVLGFLGFMPFAVECYAIYVLVRRLIPIRRQVRYLG